MVVTKKESMTNLSLSNQKREAAMRGESFDYETAKKKLADSLLDESQPPKIDFIVTPDRIRNLANISRKRDLSRD
jgi:hypothetical protein